MAYILALRSIFKIPPVVSFAQAQGIWFAGGGLSPRDLSVHHFK